MTKSIYSTPKRDNTESLDATGKESITLFEPRNLVESHVFEIKNTKDTKNLNETINLQMDTINDSSLEVLISTFKE